MRSVRALFLCIVMLTFVVPSAFAQSVEVLDEASGEHCPAVSLNVHAVSGGCFVHSSSTGAVTLLAHTGTSEVVLSSCSVEIEGRGGENGEGYAINPVLSQPGGGGSCTRAPCDEANGTKLPWEVHGEEVAGVEHGEIRFCIRSISGGPGSSGIVCHAVQTGETGVSHDYHGSGNEVPCENLPSVEVSGEFVSERDEAHDNVEVIH